MKTFVLINGSKCSIIERETRAKAIETAQNTCDHSKEIILREITELKDYTRIYINQP